MQSKHRTHGWFYKLSAIVAATVAMLAASIATSPADPPTSEEGGMMATVSSTYTLSPYDVIDVSVFGEEDLHTPAPSLGPMVRYCCP